MSVENLQNKLKILMPLSFNQVKRICLTKTVGSDQPFFILARNTVASVIFGTIFIVSLSFLRRVQGAMYLHIVTGFAFRLLYERLIFLLFPELQRI